ncbi:Uncharacterised protein [Vibrio cholerae]|nr:Uncharacterised protein [Vibrio cholerae]
MGWLCGYGSHYPAFRLGGNHSLPCSANGFYAIHSQSH